MMDKILSLLFPVTLPSVELEFQPRRHAIDPFEEPVTECGIVWVGYDVRRTGVEKFTAGQL